MKNGIARSPLFYVGDKYKLVRELKTHFPINIRRFIEPFVGGGSVFLNINAQEFLLNDYNPYVINIHRLLCSFIGREGTFFDEIFTLIERFGLSNSYKNEEIPQELKTAFPKTYFAKYNKQSYEQLKRLFNESGRTDMMQLYVLLVYGFNHMIRFNQKGLFNLPVGNVDFNRNTLEALQDYFNLTSTKQLTWHHSDFRDFLNSIDFKKGDFVYLDPPYLISNSEYNKLWNEANESALLDMLTSMNNRGIHFAISNVTHYKGKTNNLFLNWANGYNIHPIKSNYISFNDNTNKCFNEVLVTNY